MMKTLRMTALVLLATMGTASAAELTVRDAFSRATPGGGPGIVYLTIQGGDAADRLVSVSSPAAAQVMLHSMVMDGAVMRMRAVDGIDVPAGGTVALVPGAPLHLMLEGMKARLKAGERVRLVLHFEKAGDRTVDAVVGSPGQATMPR